MIPQQALSDPTLAGNYVHGEPQDYPSFSLLTDVEPGGVAVGDASRGLFGTLWTLTTPDNHQVILSAPGVAPTTLFNLGGFISEISLAFDQNMRPTVAFVHDDRAWLWWFDPVPAQQVFTVLAVDVVNPRVTLDDKRETQREASDVILAYKRGTGLYFRAQRDRYLVEYTLATGITSPLRKIAMNHKLRLQFEFGPLG